MTSLTPSPTPAPPTYTYLLCIIPLLSNPISLSLFMMPDPSRAQALQDAYEPRPDPIALTQNPDPSKNSSSGVDYEPHPEDSIKLDPEREKIVQSICNLYSGSASKEDMLVYAEEAIYDDPYSYCDTRYKIAGQWYGTSNHSFQVPLSFHITFIVSRESPIFADMAVDTCVFKVYQRS
jgi:hypothetical protein